MLAARAVRAAVPVAPSPLDTKTFVARLRAAEQASMPSRRVELITECASLQASLVRRRAEIHADEQLLALKFAELEALDRSDVARAQALAPPPKAFLTMKEACGIAGCNDATMRKKIRQHGFGWLVDRRWRISQPDLIAHLAQLDG
jgi:hypothetical protein